MPDLDSVPLKEGVMATGQCNHNVHKHLVHLFLTTMRGVFHFFNYYHGPDFFFIIILLCCMQKTHERLSRTATVTDSNCM